MAKADRVAAALSELAAMEGRARDAAGVARVRQLLGDKVPMVVLKATEAAGRWGVKEAVPELLSAFDRLMTGADPGCEGKTAIARVLTEMELGLDLQVNAVFERGIRHVQREAVWGGSVDVAAGLRGWCALGLSASGHREQVRLILPLLADAEPHGRAMAARALGQGGSDAAEALLRFKVLSGGAEAEVLGECLSALAGSWPAKSVGFIVALLNDDRLRPMAALALGECRDGAALTALLAAYKAEFSPARKGDLLRGLAVSRRAEALDFLIGVLADGPAGEAAAVIDALAPKRTTPQVWERVEAAANARGQVLLLEALARAARG